LYVTVLSEDCANFHFVRHFCCIVITASASGFKDQWCESLWFLFSVLCTLCAVNIITAKSCVGTVCEDIFPIIFLCVV